MPVRALAEKGAADAAAAHAVPRGGWRARLAPGAAGRLGGRRRHGALRGARHGGDARARPAPSTSRRRRWCWSTSTTATSAPSARISFAISARPPSRWPPGGVTAGGSAQAASLLAADRARRGRGHRPVCRAAAHDRHQGRRRPVVPLGAPADPGRGLRACQVGQPAPGRDPATRPARPRPRGADRGDHRHAAARGRGGLGPRLQRRLRRPAAASPSSSAARSARAASTAPPASTRCRGSSATGSGAAARGTSPRRRPGTRSSPTTRRASTRPGRGAAARRRPSGSGSATPSASGDLPDGDDGDGESRPAGTTTGRSRSASPRTRSPASSPSATPRTWRYVAAWGQWLTWTGTVWQREDTLQAFDLARLVCREAAARAGTVQAEGEALVRGDGGGGRAARPQRSPPRQHHRRLGPRSLAAQHAERRRRPAHRRRGVRTTALLHMTKTAGASAAGDCPTWRQFLDDGHRR